MRRSCWKPVKTRNVAARLAAATRAAGLPGVIDIVPGASTVLVTFEPGSISGPDLAGC